MTCSQQHFLLVEEQFPEDAFHFHFDERCRTDKGKLKLCFFCTLVGQCRMWPPLYVFVT